MKKDHFSPVASLLMSLSLALGILVGDVGSFKLLTSAHAQQSPCGESLNIEDGTVLSGITVRNVTVNGTVVEQAVVAGSVQLVDATLPGATGAIYANGVYVGGGGEEEGATGVYVGGGGEEEGATGVYVGGVAIVTPGAADGGTLTGDNIQVSNGVITGQNLLLSGAVIDGGPIGAAFTTVSVTPAD